MSMPEELAEEYERIVKSLELHRGLLATLQRVRSEAQSFNWVIEGEMKIIAIFGDRKRELEQKFIEKVD